MNDERKRGRPAYSTPRPTTRLGRKQRAQETADERHQRQAAEAQRRAERQARPVSERTARWRRQIARMPDLPGRLKALFSDRKLALANFEAMRIALAQPHRGGKAAAGARPIFSAQIIEFVRGTTGAEINRSAPPHVGHTVERQAVIDENAADLSLVDTIGRFKKLLTPAQCHALDEFIKLGIAYRRSQGFPFQGYRGTPGRFGVMQPCLVKHEGATNTGCKRATVKRYDEVDDDKALFNPRGGGKGEFLAPVTAADRQRAANAVRADIRAGIDKPTEVEGLAFKDIDRKCNRILGILQFDKFEEEWSERGSSLAKTAAWPRRKSRNSVRHIEVTPELNDYYMQLLANIKNKSYD
jgi:hypothetical protein